MDSYWKLLAASAIALAAALPASAEVRVGIYANSPGAYYYPPVVPAPRGYAAVPDYYYGDRYYADPHWRARQEWRARREAEWRRAEWLRREEWQREQWRRGEQWRGEQWRGGDRWHDHEGRRHGRD